MPKGNLPPAVSIVMAVFRPNEAFLSEQIASIAVQDWLDFEVVFVIADGTSASLTKRLAEAAGLRHRIVTPPTPLDSPRAFECGLTEALKTAGPDTLFALSDQDDIWHPDRLSKGISALRASGADLVHSDARLIGDDGAVRHNSMFAFEGRHRAPGLRMLLYRNSVTGMTVLMRRRLVEIALPFPAQSGVHYYHDLWLALLAASMGGIRLIADATVDYRQHSENAIGAIDRRARSRFVRFNGVWLRQEAGAYALARYLAKSAVLRMHEAIELKQVPGGQAKLTPLKPYLRRLRGPESHAADVLKLFSGGHLRMAAIALNHGIIGVGRVIWALRHAFGPGLNAAADQFEHRLYSLSPGIAPSSGEGRAPEQVKSVHTGIIDRRKHAPWRPEFAAKDAAINVLVPTLNPTEMFAGIVTALDIGLGLAAKGLRVRFIATDLPVAAHQTSKEFLRQRCTAGAEKYIELCCGVTERTIAMHRGDRFLATAWWTAHVVDTLLREEPFRQKEFLYLIQDYEPNFYPWGSEFADAVASYGFNFEPIFNTTILRDYFATLGYAFARPDTLAFAPAIAVERYAKIPRAARGARRKLALYGRPEVPRNLFPMAIEVIARFIEEEKLGPADIELVSIGMKHKAVEFANGVTLQSLGKLAWENYPAYLAGVDIGLSLMLSPHPSHPPIEMAAAGARVVTNTFATKDLGRLSPAIHSVGASTPELLTALRTAWKAGPVTEKDRRIDLSILGEPIGQVVEWLAETLSAPQKPARTRRKTHSTLAKAD